MCVLRNYKINDVYITIHCSEKKKLLQRVSLSHAHQGYRDTKSAAQMT